jgi:hypothetical protein
MSNLGELLYNAINDYFISDITDIIMEYVEHAPCQNCRKRTPIYLLFEYMESLKFLCVHCMLAADRAYTERLYQQRYGSC